MVFLYQTYKKNQQKGRLNMLDKEILELRQKLNESITNKENYYNNKTQKNNKKTNHILKDT